MNEDEENVLHVAVQSEEEDSDIVQVVELLLRDK